MGGPTTPHARLAVAIQQLNIDYLQVDHLTSKIRTDKLQPGRKIGQLYAPGGPQRLACLTVII